VILVPLRADRMAELTDGLGNRFGMD